jgi:hypothetical protein
MNNSLRLYLDTADLIGVADAKRVRRKIIDGLLAACQATATTLVVSLWHVADVRAAPSDAARRVIEAVDRFPSRGLITLDSAGVMLLPLESFASVVDENPAAVQFTNNLATFITTLDQSFEVPNSAIPERQLNLCGQLTLAMAIQETDEDALRVGRAFLHRNRREIPSERHETMLQSLVQSPIWNLRQQLRALGAWNQTTLADAVYKRDVRPASGEHVGEHLGILVDQRRRRLRDRSVQDGDLADRHHVEFAPYVDVFTGDKDVCAWLDEWRSKIPYERSVRAIKSNHLETVIDALNALHGGRQR